MHLERKRKCRCSFLKFIEILFHQYKTIYTKIDNTYVYFQANICKLYIKEEQTNSSRRQSIGYNYFIIPVKFIYFYFYEF